MSELSGRFLPMDPRDERILDILEKDNSRQLSLEDEAYGPEGPPSVAYGDSSVPGRPKKWSKRSEAARKRWADPSYRAKMLEKRAEKRRKDAEAAGEVTKHHKVEIGRMDSITLCDDDKAKAINDYARSNKLRAEKMSAFHRDRKLWMEQRLGKGLAGLTDEEYHSQKKEAQQRRREIALERSKSLQKKKTTETEGT